MLYFSRLILRNWRNFRFADIPLQTRMFIVGPNASGKSNILDAIRFLKDICREGGGLRTALSLRSGISKIRSLFARDPSDVTIGCEICDDEDNTVRWKYELILNQAGGGVKDLRPVVKSEKVWQKDAIIVDKTKDEDPTDSKLKEFTLLEQPIASRQFRELVDFFSEVRYLHLVPQLVKTPNAALGGVGDEYFGTDFIPRAARLNANIRNSYFKKIQKALQLAVPQFKGLDLVTDEQGRPHLQTTFQHWRAQGSLQWEAQFSDGTLRLVGFLWALLEGRSPLLLEEPELSLHSAIVKNLAEIITKLQQRKNGRRQVIATTHSAELLSDLGISGEEIVTLFPEEEGTSAKVASSIDDIRVLLENGLPAGDVVFPATSPMNVEQLLLEL